MSNEAIQLKQVEQNRPVLWTKEFMIIIFSNFFLFFSFQMLVPTLPVYTARVGGDAFAVGLVMSMFTVSALLARPFAGKALDTMGRRQVLFTGLLIFIVCNIGFYWMTTVLLVLALRFIHGIGWGIATTSYGTLVADVIPSQRRGEGMGYYSLASTFALALAPLMGIWLMNEMGFAWLFMAAAIFCILGLLLSLFLQNTRLPEQENNTSNAGNIQPATKKNTKKEPFYKDLVETKSLFPALLMLLVGIIFSGVISFITLFGEEKGIENVGWFFLANAATLLFTRPLAGKLFDVKGHRWVLFPGILFFSLAVLTLSYAQTSLHLVYAAILYGAGFGAIQPSLLAWTINIVPANKRGTATGQFYSAFDLGIGGGALFLGAIANATSYAQMYRISVILALLFVIVYVWYLYKEGKRKEA